ncbi:hypothetical protein J27TS8_19570 [Robertmurraya siralis]|uniref:Uncharacterized protein n=1 Tax=Robertmurraya siralis TaxID=77777 RepID=A0A919WHS3_9BACI|nr:hypothetical protein J27TS8_19570 [Robertmurraya siralis]
MIICLNNWDFYLMQTIASDVQPVKLLVEMKIIQTEMFVGAKSLSHLKDFSPYPVITAIALSALGFVLKMLL